MVNNQKTAFQLRVSNVIATLKFFAQRGVISYQEHFDWWVRLLRTKTDKELDEFVQDLRDLINKKKAEGLGLD